MTIDKLPEFAKDGQKNTDDLVLTDGFPVQKKPARQWFNFLFNALTLKINEIIDADFIPKSDVVDNLTTDDATKPVSAAQAKKLQDNKLDKTDLKDASTTQNGIVQLNNTLTSTSTVQAATANTVRTLNNQAFGVGQTWQNVLANRVSGTTYTNTTSKTITVYIEISSSSADVETNTIQVDDIVLSSGDWGINGMRSVVSFPVPSGSTYKVTTVNANSVIRSWSELR